MAVAGICGIFTKSLNHKLGKKSGTMLNNRLLFGGMLALLFLLAAPAKAQPPAKVVDMESMARRFEGPSGQAAYAELENKFEQGETLKLDDYRNLYYGSAFQDGHEMRDYVNSRNLAKLMSPAKASLLVARCDSILAIRSVDLAANYFKGLGLFLLDTLSTEAIRYRTRYANLMEAIISSGTGAGCGSAFLVLSQQDALETMRFLGIPGFTGDKREENCQVFRIRASPIYSATVIHFDLTYAAAEAPESSGSDGSNKSDKKKRKP